MLSRRRFVQVGMGVSLSLSIMGCSSPLQEEKNNQVTDACYGFWVDAAACVACMSCVNVCKEKNGTDDNDMGRRRIVSYSFSDGSTRFVSLACMHCGNPACLEVCPAGAISKREDGIVVVDQGACIGCKYCQQACPFGIPRYTSKGMDKCDCCLALGREPNEQPFCVSACPADALHFGFLSDLKAQAGSSAHLIDAPTDPSFLISL